jgi:hypothetical protein
MSTVLKKLTFLQRMALSILFMFLSGNVVYSQTAFVEAQMSDFMGQVNKNHQINSNFSQIEGSPYLTEDFVEGEIYFDGKYRLPNVPMRVNLYNGEVEFKNKNAILAIANPERIDKLVIGDDTFIFLDGKATGEISGLVKKWNDDQPAVITKMEIEYKPKEEPKPFEEPKPDRFERSRDEHYLFTENSEVVRIKSVKKLIKILGDHQSELTDFSKKEKISNNDPEELAKLLVYYHSLE